MSELDTLIRARAAALRGEAAALLSALVRIPADFVAEDPSCGLSNHEGPRLELLKRRIVEMNAVRNPEDVDFDAFGNLVWSVEDPSDGIPRDQKKVVWFDGHSDTVAALRDDWRERTGGLDAYDGVVDMDKVDRAFLRDELGWLPPDEEWDQLVFGRGSADQLGGVVCQAFATRILLELAPKGALKGVIVKSFATVCEEDNDGAGPMYLLREELPNAAPGDVPDLVVLTEGTGDAYKGALGIYRGQRGRMQIEVDVNGRSCHGSMPWEGLNPFEFGGAIVAEAATRYQAGEGFLQDDFLGGGTRTASWARLDTPSDCAVPQRLLLRFDRRLTVGETPEQAVADVEALDAVAAAREAGLTVEVRIPTYTNPSWRGYVLNNPQVYPGWVTPEDHPMVEKAAEAYGRVVSNGEPARVDRWIFSTDGVGFVTREAPRGAAAKDWVKVGTFTHPPMLGFGPGIEQNTHKIGECVHSRELECAMALYSRLPSLVAGVD